MLAAAAFVLLYFGGISPYVAVAACVAAGALSAVPLMRRARVKLAVSLYLAVSVLALILVPRKSLAAGYILLCGLYPIVKYGIEARLPQRIQLLCKLVYFNLVLAAMYLLVQYGFLPQLEVKGIGVLAIGWVVANVVFVIYDIGLSRLIATLRTMLPPD